jgi:Bacterial Ig domain
VASPPAGASGFSWSVVPSPNTSPTQENELNGVSCSGPSACIAVGFYDTPEPHPQIRTAYQTLIESWNGSAWSIVPSPNTSPTQDNLLKGVSCSGPSACIAVGEYFTGSTDQTLIESWNGSAWSIVPSPNTSPTQDNLLNGVSCSGPSACVAGGNYFTGTKDQTLIESWNGSAWSIVPSPNTSPTQNNALTGVSCNLPAACVAVGAYYLSGDFSQTLIESWNGSAWSIVPSPNTSPTQINLLRGVSCSSPSACTAFGFYEPSNNSDQTLIESWNGSAWSIVPSPNTSPTQNNELSGVSCSSPSFCTAVGYSDSGSFQTLIESWNGSAWSIVPSPNASQINLLLGVSCLSPSACTAVGYYGSSQTLIERLTTPMTSVIVPASGATVSGTTTLDASASNATSVEFQLFGGVYSFYGPIICTATPTYYGWLCSWNTTTVPNGSYLLSSLAFNSAGSAYSLGGVNITVNNPTPTTSVVIPSNGATQSGTAALLDASASANVTSVKYELTGGTLTDQVIATATPTYYGWLAQWNTTTVPNGTYTLQSVAAYSGGVSGTSPGVAATVNN